MALDAPTRESLVRFLADVGGHANAADLVSRLEFEVNDLATRSDIAELVARFDGLDRTVDGLESKLEVQRHELIGVFRGELLSAVTFQTRSLLVGLFSTMAVFTAALVAVVKLG